MRDNIFTRISGKMNYNQYKNMMYMLFSSKIILTLGAFSGIIFPDELSFCVNNIGYLLGLVGTLEVMADSFKYFSCEQYTKDVTYIRSLYSEFVKNYNKLNKTFELNSPMEIYLLFYYLLYQGYLSKDKIFKFEDKNSVDIMSIYGVNIFTGNAVCRHIASMLSYIMNDYGIMARQMMVYASDAKLSYNVLDYQKYTKEELIDWIKNSVSSKEDCESLISYLEELIKKYGNIELYYEYETTESKKERKYGNHAITYAIYEGKKYFLDATCGYIYKQSSDLVLSSLGYECNIKGLLPQNFEGNGSDKMNKVYEYENICEDEKRRVKEKMKLICEDNKDMFMQFYNENRELYDEVSNKLLNIKARKLSK